MSARPNGWSRSAWARCLTVFGLTGRRLSPLALAAGGFLLYRGLAGNCPMYQAVGVGTDGPSGDGGRHPGPRGGEGRATRSRSTARPARSTGSGETCRSSPGSWTT